MFGSLTQMQFSVFEFRKWWAQSLVLLFGNCFLCLNSNTNTVLTLLKSTIQKISFCCFHLLNSVLSNIKIFSFTSAQNPSLFNSHIFCLYFSRCLLTQCWLRRVEELQLEVESREPPPPPVEADLETHLGFDATNLASLSHRHDLEPHHPKRIVFLVNFFVVLLVCCVLC